MTLDGLGEFGLIGLIRERFSAIPAPGCMGIGDDCAVIPASEEESFVVTTDLLIEGVHFLRDRITPHELGRKSLAVNLSDVAAMGAAPFASFLSFALPADVTATWVTAFLDGYRALSDEFSVPLLGGDTTASKGGLSISVTAVGRAKNRHLKYRSGAKPEEVICVTGPLGDSAQGLQDILAGKTDSRYIALHNNPKPFVKEGIWLGEKSEVRAMMDISDGIASDLCHILHASGVGAEVSLEMIPTNIGVKMAVSGGEDYKLLLTVSAERAAALRADYRARFGEELYEIGRIVAGTPQIRWLDRGREVKPDWSGFSHF